jgi:rfaE bifunctional protein kinase chain/domain
MNSHHPLPSRERLASLIHGLSRRRVLLVGDLAADRYLVGRSQRVSREAPVVIVRQTGEFTIPGQAGNTAANLASLGACVSMAALLGDDSEGQSLREELERRGVDTQPGCIVAAGTRTLTKTRILAGSHHTRLQQVARIDREDTGEPSPQAIAALGETLPSLVDWAEIVIASDYGYHSINVDIWQRLRHLTRQRGIELVLDSRHRLSVFREADVITPNEPEALELIGHSDALEPPPPEALSAEARRRSGARHVLLKRGNHGMCLREEASDVPAIFGVHGAEEAVDVSGAGDTVVATLAAARVAGATWLEAAHLANIAAGITVQRVGAASTNPAELLEALHTWPSALQPAT